VSALIKKLFNKEIHLQNQHSVVQLKHSMQVQHCSEVKKLDQPQNEDPGEDAHVELQHVTLQHVRVQPSNFHQELLDSPTTPACFRAIAPLLVPPKSISTVTKDQRLLVLTRSWRTLGACFALCVAIVFNGFMIMLNCVVSDGTSIVFFVVLPFNAVALCFTYAMATSFLNCTVLTVDKSQSTAKVEHLPLSFGCPAHTHSTLHTVTVRCRRNIQLNDSSSRTSYDVRLVDQNSIDDVVMTALPNVEEALHLAQELEDFLGLQTARIPSPTHVNC